MMVFSISSAETTVVAVENETVIVEEVIRPEKTIITDQMLPSKTSTVGLHVQTCSTVYSNV